MNAPPSEAQRSLFVTVAMFDHYHLCESSRTLEYRKLVVITPFPLSLVFFLRETLHVGWTLSRRFEAVSHFSNYPQPLDENLPLERLISSGTAPLQMTWRVRFFPRLSWGPPSSREHMEDKVTPPRMFSSAIF